MLAASGDPVNPGRWIFTYQLTAEDPQDVDNTITVTGDGFDPDTSNNYDQVEHEFTAVADLSITKDDSVDPVVAGENLVYTLDVSNVGPSLARNVEVLDTLPLGVSVVADGIVVDPGPGTCTTVQASTGNQEVQCNLGDLDVGEGQTITIEVLVDQNLPDGLVLFNRAEVTSDNFDPDNANNIATESTTIASEPGLSVIKVADPFVATAGMPLDYTITVNNTGSSDAHNLIVTDDLPFGVTFQDAQVAVGAGTCANLPAGTVTCQLPLLQAGEYAEITVSVFVEPDPALCGTTLRNYVDVVSDEDPQGAFYELFTDVECDADLAIQKTVEPQKQNAGEQVKYTIQVTNNGPTTAIANVVMDTLPPRDHVRGRHGRLLGRRASIRRRAARC